MGKTDFNLNSKDSRKRVETIDWLRGLTAFSIMLYHFFGWYIRPLDASSFLGRLGIYGVSISIMLSGLSMAIAYRSGIKGLSTSISFLIRRIFRIWPLYWIACFLMIFSPITRIDWKLLLLNLTTLFGFLKPEAYMVIGGWLIGNEMVYYILTPFIILAYNFRTWLGNIFLVLSLIVGIIFAFILLDPKMSLSQQWVTYINPFNNLFLYILGIAIYFNLNKIKLNQNLNIVLLMLTVLLFYLHPVAGNQILIVSGVGRLVFVAFSLLIVFLFYKLKIPIPKLINAVLKKLGIIAYGIYLLHPIVFLYIAALSKFGSTKNLLKISIQNNILMIISLMIVTICISIFSYTIFETRFMKFGKKISNLFEKNS